MKENTTIHKIITGNSMDMTQIESNTVNLIVTSPPYPMIKMWDTIFSKQDKTIQTFLEDGNGYAAFNKMHDILDSVWQECDRVLTDNGFVCINIGDATRNINNNFQLYPNHIRIIEFFLKRGYCMLPDIHWRKQSNAPNKFMGSGMYPAGAYVTYEHEYILIFRKGSKRKFNVEEKRMRQKSAFFWEERNIWFSDLWDIKGTTQKIITKTSRDRSAAYPLEIPYRLINMYSIENDTVLDPFVGLGTTSLASMIAKRNSIGIDVDPEITSCAIKTLKVSPNNLNKVIHNRLKKHIDFINSLPDEKKVKCYDNIQHGFKVKTKQEVAIKIDSIRNIYCDTNSIICEYV